MAQRLKYSKQYFISPNRLKEEKTNAPQFAGCRLSGKSSARFTNVFFHATVLKCGPLFLDVCGRIRYHYSSTAGKNMFK